MRHTPALSLLIGTVPGRLLFAHRTSLNFTEQSRDAASFSLLLPTTKVASFLYKTQLMAYLNDLPTLFLSSKQNPTYKLIKCSLID